VELFVPGALWKRPPPPVKRPLKVLSAAESERVAENKAVVLKHMPELVPVIKELHEVGLIDGWRSVGAVVIHASTGSARTDITNEGNGHGTA
jgi:hypothetical protein